MRYEMDTGLPAAQQTAILLTAHRMGGRNMCPLLSALQASSMQLALGERCKAWRRAAVNDGLGFERGRPEVGLLRRDLGAGVGLCTSLPWKAVGRS